MDIRTVPNPIVRAGGRWLRRVNDRHPWSHNDHFHGWILRRLPTRRRRALDVGCGAGLLLSRLRGRFDEALGVEADAAMAGVATERFAGDPVVSVRHARFEKVDGTFDTITMVAVLHHLPLEASLRHAAELLEPGGRLLVVGLARAETLTDLAWDLPSSLLNPLVGMVRHPRPVTAPVDDGGPPLPMRDPAETFADISRAVRRVPPGARLRRRLFFRYTLEWTRPV
ncbi:Methyltransferase domain-containing protein [Promicromonospora umidemergens]|uniref:Class I SAM-dependent methyltransferase n=1 Tax=Promicromonospora umidemergens TaxID=629679 RepID=A0ABP8X3P3_9MICO|nr:class I SAM-dependent methyltransferase [Promicromonospora umidemergens]MCP2285021.1 Methyltransferase domain-containing protein [Promicromonospora umidemergens]